VLTGHWIGRRRGAGSLALRFCGGVRVEHGDEVDAAMLRASGSRGSTRGGAAEVQRGPGIAGGEQLLRKQFTCGGGSRGNSSEVVPEAEGNGLGDGLGLGAELLLRSAVAGM